MTEAIVQHKTASLNRRGLVFRKLSMATGPGVIDTPDLISQDGVVCDTVSDARWATPSPTARCGSRHVSRWRKITWQGMWTLRVTRV